MPEISIVIPTYNGSRFILETIDSVRRQTFSDWELIVVDDGSKDDTREVVEKSIVSDARIRLIRQENGGESAARNTGYEHIDEGSMYVIFLDHDDLWEPETLSSLREMLQKNPSAVGAYGIGQFVDADGRPTQPGELESWCRLRKKRMNGRWIDCAPDEPTTFGSLAAHNSIPTPGVCLFRRSLLPPNPLFPTAMRAGSGDVELFLRLALHADFVFLDKQMIRGRRHESNITNDGRRNDRTLKQAYQNVINLPDTSTEQQVLLVEGYQWRYREKSRHHLVQFGKAIAEGRLVTAAREVLRATRSYFRSVTGLH